MNSLQHRERIKDQVAFCGGVVCYIWITAAGPEVEGVREVRLQRGRQRDGATIHVKAIDWLQM